MRGLIVLLFACGLTACAAGSSDGQLAAYLRTPEGFAGWRQGEGDLKREAQAASEQYQHEASLPALQAYEKAVRAYLDHGLLLYRSYQAAKFDLPPDLEDSLEQRTAQLMDVADEYIKQHSTAMGVGIASEIVVKYSDLHDMSAAQRRAEAVLLRYRYRQDY
jgi:hypothetical protein